MTLDEFIVKNKINLSGKVIHVCEAGIEIMRHSINPLYDERHIFGILANLDRLLEEEKNLDKSKINFEVLLLAICWHDVWRTKRFPLNIISFIFNHSHEGTGSMSMFSQIAAVFDLDKRLIRSVRYAIRKHSGLQFKRLTTLEAKILKDMDSLEEWSLSRLKPIVDGNVFFNVMNSKAIRLAKFYFDNFMVRDSAKSFHFEWSKAEFTKRKEAYLVEARKLVEEAVKFKIIKK